jgi:chromosome segregation ATPase
MARAAKKRAPSSTAIGRVEIMLEDLSSQMKIFAESVGANFDSLRREMHELHRSLEVRIEVLESVVRQNSRDIEALRTDVSSLKTDVASLKTEVASLKTDVASLRTELRTEVASLRADIENLRAEVATKTELQLLEARVSRIEARVFP